MAGYGVRNERLDDGSLVVVRGNRLGRAALRVDAVAAHARFGQHGISVFAAEDAGAIDDLARARLARFQPLGAERFVSGDGDALRNLVVVRSGQRVFKDVIEAYLQRIDYGPDGYARLIRLPAYDVASVVADPRRAFGQPIFEHGGARLDDVLERFWAGDSIEELADEFGVPPVEVEDVLRAASRRAVSRHAGRAVRHPADEKVDDPRWLADAGLRSECVFMKDRGVRYNTAGKAAILDHQVRCFCLARQNLAAADMAERFLTNLDRIAEACAEIGGALYVVHERRIERPLLPPGQR